MFRIPSQKDELLSVMSKDKTILFLNFVCFFFGVVVVTFFLKIVKKPAPEDSLQHQ